MERSTNPCGPGRCTEHYHLEDPIFLNRTQHHQTEPGIVEQTTAMSEGPSSVSGTTAASEASTENTSATGKANTEVDPNDKGFRRIIRNFTPSWFIITMSTGITSIILHQLPYNGSWLQIISVIFFVFNLCLFLLFSFISFLRYLMYPELIPAVLRHPHQSLFLGTFPVGLATIINMTVLVCAPVWGHGMATLAWVLWWIDLVIALATCFHLTFVIMSNRRSELSEMTALYLIPIVAVVIVATSGGLVAGALPNPQHQLWTLIISYILWGLGSPLSWMVLTLYLLRLTIHEPLKREVIVSLLMPIGALSISGFCILVLGKLAKRVFPETHALPHAENAGNVLYIIGCIFGLVLWGFALVWFGVAVAMLLTSGGFPFNMGWWGFIFPVGVFTLLTLTLGDELESKFFKVLSCILTVIVVITWVGVAARTIKRSITGQMFYAPCLGTDLYQKKRRQRKATPVNVGKETMV